MPIRHRTGRRSSARRSTRRFYWPDDYFREVWGHAAAIRLIGHQTIDGVPTDVVLSVRTDVTAWSRLWIDARGVVHREEMRAEGHIMDHRYVAYDQASAVESPRDLTACYLSSAAWSCWFDQSTASGTARVV